MEGFGNISPSSRNKRQLVCGFAVIISTIITYASLLAIVTTVVKTKSVAYMPFNLSLFVFFCSSSWCAAVLSTKTRLSIPKCLGGFTQLVLYAVYRNNGEAAKSCVTGNPGSCPP